MMKLKLSLMVLACSSSMLSAAYSKETGPAQITYNRKIFYLYPETLDECPDIPSPFTTENGVEIVVVFTKNDKYALIPVTVANGPLNLKYGSKKNRQR